MVSRTIYCLLLALGMVLTGHGQSTIVVNATDDTDDGTCDAVHCSLREAFKEANSDLQPSRIIFAIGAGSTETIVLDDALPILTEDSTEIDGTTQTGAPGGVRIDCGNIGPQTLDIIRIHSNHTDIYGLEIFNYTVSEDMATTGEGSLIGIGGVFVLASPATIRIGAPGKGNILHSTYRARSTAANYANGIAVHSGTEIIIQGNRIGTDYSGTMSLEIYGEGIRIDENNFGETQIGGSAPGEGNIIGNSFNGIGIYGGDGWIKGNSIGVDQNLITNHGNRNSGIFIADGQYYEIGGTQAAEGNVCNNNINGIEIRSLSTIYVGNNTCANNDAMGAGIYTGECPDCIFEYNDCFNNGRGIQSDDYGNTRTLIRYNAVHHNIMEGVYVILQATSTNMTITQNSHFCNQRGIGVGIQAPTYPFDAMFINSVDQTQVIGTANADALIEIFRHDTQGCPMANCQGKHYIGSTTADNTGLWIYTGALAPGSTYTTTQTLPNGNTSPFGPCFTIPDCSTIVTTPADNGAGSLREAIECANARPGPDTITFDIMGGIPRTITLNSPLPSLIDNSTVIDATTQSGNAPMNNQITIDCGNFIGPGAAGLDIDGDSCEIYGLVIVNSPGTALIAGSPLDPINYTRIGAPDKYNVFVDNSSYGSVIYAGNQVLIQSNYFGGNQGLSNPSQLTQIGCNIVTSDVTRNVQIGGSRAMNEGNFFVFNEASGLTVAGNDLTPVREPVLIWGNYFGTDATEIIRAGNGSGAATAALTTHQHHIEIGDMDPDHSNTFAYNDGYAINGSYGSKTIFRNSFFCNTAGGINWTNNIPPGNPLVSAPMIARATDNVISGTAQGAGIIQVYYHNNEECSNAPCQGRIFLGETSASNDGSWQLNGPFPILLNIADEVTATYTSFDQTSEFSPCVEVCPELLIEVNDDGPYCLGETVVLTTTVNSSSTDLKFVWTGPNNYMSTDPNPAGIKDSGVYTLILTVDGCEYPPIDTRVEIYPSDTINIDTTLCKADFIAIGGERFDSSRTSGTITLTNQYDCDSIINVSINIVDAPVMTIKDSLCFDDQLTINGKIYNRNNTSGQDTFDRGNLCDSIVFIELFFYPRLIDTFRQTLCEDDIITINGKIYDKNNPSGIDTIPTNTDCDSIIVVDLTFGSSMVFSIDTTLCPGDDLLVNGILYDQFYPSGSDTIPNGSISGCDSIIQVNVTYPDPSFDVDTISPTCDGSREGQIIINGINGIPAPFQYSLNGSPFRSIASLPWSIGSLDEGKYDLIVNDGMGCNFLVQVELSISGQLIFDVSDDVEISLGDSTVLTYTAAFTPDSVIWSTGSGVICRNCNGLTVKPGQSTIYTVTLFKDGCQSSATIEVTVDDSIDFFIPNIFSPDGNNINDFLNVFSSQPGVIIETFQVFDRWGEMIYHGENLSANDSNKGWDGTFNGEDVPPGVYVYRVVIALPGRQETLSGEVTILR